MLSATFAVLTAIGALISVPIPFSPVPITLQTIFVLLSGALLGSKRAALSQLIYLALGLVGFPVFAGGASGPVVLIGPTGGYLIGFVLGAFLAGWLMETWGITGFTGMLFCVLGGLVVIYAFGIIGLSLWFKSNITTLMDVGLLPFLPGDALKAVVTAYIASRRHMRQFLYG